MSINDCSKDVSLSSAGVANSFENVPANVLAKMTKIGEVVKENINNSKLYRYYAGTYNDYAAANTRLQEVKTAGFNDAFVKPLLDGKQISIENAKTLSE